LAKNIVASRVEAWIETQVRWMYISAQRVASRVEAWIETPTAWEMILTPWCRLPRGGVD